MPTGRLVCEVFEIAPCRALHRQQLELGAVRSDAGACQAGRREAFAEAAGAGEIRARRQVLMPFAMLP